MSKLHGHVAQSAKTDYANFLALGNAPVMHGRVCRDPSTKKWRGSGKIKIGGDAQDEAFVNDDAFGVAAVGHASEVFVWRVEGEDHVRAELLKASLALWAGTVRIDHAADRGEITWLVLGNCRADLGHTADNLMAGDNRVDSRHELAPLVAHQMQIGVANAAEQNFNLHIAFGWFATVDLGGSQRRRFAGSGVGLRVVGGWVHS